jgi:hypothetical protein
MGGDQNVMDEVCENLRTIEVEVGFSADSRTLFFENRLQTIQYLSAEYQPTPSQSPSRITKLVKDLAPFDLTKAEKLQIVNLAPIEIVELYVVRAQEL